MSSPMPPCPNALAYVEALRRHCLGLAEFPERGTRRDAIRPGLRTLGYRRRVTIAFQVTGSTVTILRLLYAGRALEGRAGQDEAD